MASDERGAADHLTRLDALAATPEKYHVFQALRIIEASFPDHPRLGRSTRPSQDPVRLGQEAELAFPPSTIAGFDRGAGGAPARLSNYFFGLFGPNGPLPLHLTEYARDRQRNEHDPTLVAFANIFHHRMMSFLYRAWSSAEPAPSFDRPDSDPMAEKVAATAGWMGKAMRARDAMPDLAKLHFAGRLAHGPRNEEGLLAIVSAFFRAPTKIESFVGSWLELEESDRWRLGAPGSFLGGSTAIGSRVWSRQAKFRIHIGPLGLEEYNRLLPGGDSLRRLRAIVRNYLGDVLDWDVKLILGRRHAPKAVLGQQGRLGWTVWLGDPDHGQDRDDLCLHPNVGAYS